MKKFAIQTILLLLVIAVGVYFFNPNQSSRKIDFPFLPSQANFSNIKINDVTIKAEVADTSAKRGKGLGGRSSLGESEGMLFIFEKLDKYPFWMKGLSFPLDFVWIKDNKVVDLLENVPSPKPNQADSDLPIYSSSTEVNKVLELNAGSVKKFNIKVGDEIK